MEFAEIIRFCEEETMDDRIDISSINLIDGEIYAVNGFVALPIENLATFYGLDSDIDILDESGEVLGVICFKKSVEVPTEFTDMQLIAYINDVNLFDYESGQARINNNYVVVKADMYQQYKLHYYHTAPIWGNFSHESSNRSPHKLTVDKLEAVKVRFPTIHHQDSINRAIQQPYGFERFLKKYHMLELLFDLDFVEGIKKLNTNNLKGIGKLVQEFNKKEEIERLRQVVYRRSANIDLNKLSVLLNKIETELALAIEMFFDYGKEKSNPFPNSELKSSLDKFNELMLNANPFKFENVKVVIPKVNNQEKFRKFLIDVSTYWIYRVRCSIAHSKIGEYILKSDDEKFVVEIIEPLLELLITECFADR